MTTKTVLTKDEYAKKMDTEIAYMMHMEHMSQDEAKEKAKEYVESKFEVK